MTVAAITSSSQFGVFGVGCGAVKMALSPTTVGGIPLQRWLRRRCALTSSSQGSVGERAAGGSYQQRCRTVTLIQSGDQQD